MKSKIESKAVIDFLLSDAGGLRNRNFSGLDLSGISFAGQDLSGTFFTDSNLDGADFSGASFRKGGFDRVSAKEAVFDNAVFFETDAEHSVFDRAHFHGTSFTMSSFSDSSMARTDFSGSKHADSLFIGTDLSFSDFSRSDIKASEFVRTPLCGASFGKAAIDATQYKDVSFRGVPADFTGTAGSCAYPEKLEDENVFETDKTAVYISSEEFAGRPLVPPEDGCERAVVSLCPATKEILIFVPESMSSLISAGEVGAALWGSGAEPRGGAVCSPEGAAMNADRLIEATMMVEEKSAEITVGRLAELSDIREQLSEAVAEYVNEKGLDGPETGRPQDRG